MFSTSPSKVRARGPGLGKKQNKQMELIKINTHHNKGKA